MGRRERKREGGESGECLRVEKEKVWECWVKGWGDKGVLGERGVED